MTDEKRERREFFRGRAKPGHALAVRFRAAAGDAAGAAGPAAIAAEAHDIGDGGAFITGYAGAAPSVGMTVTVELVVPDSDRTLAIPSVVRWHGERDGFGVQFVGVDADVLLELTEYFARL